MGRCIIHLDGKFMEWTSITDSPCSPLLPEPLFITYWRKEYGRYRLWELPRLLDMAKKFQTSAPGFKLADIIRKNRAGHKEKHLSKSELIETYSCTPEEFLDWSQKRDMNAEKYFAEETEQLVPNPIKKS